MTDSTSRTVRENRDRHRFEIDLGGGEIAFAEYRLSEGRIEFTHTVVPPAHEGQGIGTLLVAAGLAAARERGLKVIPACPFFADYMKKHSEAQDLLDPASRKELGLD